MPTSRKYAKLSMLIPGHALNAEGQSKNLCNFITELDHAFALIQLRTALTLLTFIDTDALCVPFNIFKMF